MHEEYVRGLRDAIEEIKGWRSIELREYHTLASLPEEYLRETKAKLNLLAYIEFKLRKMAGDSLSDIYTAVIERDQIEIYGYSNTK